MRANWGNLLLSPVAESERLVNKRVLSSSGFARKVVQGAFFSAEKSVAELLLCVSVALWLTIA